MKVKSDIDIARGAKLKDINKIAQESEISREYLEQYGSNKGKVNYNILKGINNNKDGKLILVTAINPTPAGEGKTTTSIGLGDSLRSLGHKTIICIREPSLGPVFGMKGGAAGGGYSQVVPMEDINLHFTGDIHAVGTANNLISAALDNHIYQGNTLDIDPKKVTWKRCVDMNDRQLRNIVCGLGAKTNGIAREEGFDITVASEIMAVLCLAQDINDLKQKISSMVIAYTRSNQAVTVGDLKIQGAVTSLLKDALKPNLVQTLEHTPAFVHGGPFANIAHGCSSLISTKIALKLSEYVVTEAGFGADLGAEKFLNIKCRKGNLKPSAVVIVATVRALKYNGGTIKSRLNEIDLPSLEKGIPNLLKHIENITVKFGLPAVVAINKFPTDTMEEIDMIKKMCSNYGVEAVVSDVWEKGSKGGIELANKVIETTKKPNDFRLLYKSESTIEKKIEAVVKEIYGGKSVEFSARALDEIKNIEAIELDKLPVCIAKTQYSLSDNPHLLGRPEGFTIMINDVRLRAGAGFITVYAGSILTMPGLPKKPAAENIDIDSEGNIDGLF